MFTLGLDARATEPGFKAHFGRGTGRYATELLAELERINRDTENSDIRILKLTGSMLQGHSLERQMLQLLPFGRQTAETQVFLPRRLGKIPADVLHFVAHGDATARSRMPSSA